jgi:hypothetical protein
VVSHVNVNTCSKSILGRDCGGFESYESQKFRGKEEFRRTKCAEVPNDELEQRKLQMIRYVLPLVKRCTLRDNVAPAISGFVFPNYDSDVNQGCFATSPAGRRWLGSKTRMIFRSSTKVAC